MRGLLRVLYPLLLATAFLLAGAQPAHAAFGVDCNDAPPVASGPDGGTAGFFGGRPDQTPTDPDGGAWANGAPIYANYGLAGLSFNTYDFGCTGAATDPGGPIGTTVANWILEIPKVAVAATVALLRAAFNPDFLQVFDPLLTTATSALRDAIFTEWAPVVLAGIGALIILGSRKRDLSGAGTTAGWAILVMVLASAVFRFPVQAGSFADQAVGDVLGAVNSSINGQGSTDDPVDAAASTFSNAVLFQQWKRGTFGSTDSPTADKYAKTIYMSKALTWAEAATVADDPQGAGKALLEAKAKSYEDTAEKIKEEDPAAYQYLTGHGEASGARVGAAGIATLAAVCALLFLIGTALLMLAFFLLVRIGVMFSPILATFGLSYRHRQGVVHIVGMMVAALVNCIIFGTAAAVNIVLGGILLSGAIPAWLGLILMVVLAVLLAVALWPIAKSLTKVTTPTGVVKGGMEAIGNAGGTTKDAVVGGAKRAGSAAVTGWVAGTTAMDRVEERLEDRAHEKANARAARPAAPTVAQAVPTTATPQTAPRTATALPAAPVPGTPVAALPVAATPAADRTGPLPPDGTQTHGPAWPMPPRTVPDVDPADLYVPDSGTGPAPRVSEPIEPTATAEGDVYDLFVPDDAEVRE